MQNIQYYYHLFFSLLKNKYGKDKANELLKIQGLDEDKFDIFKYREQMLTKGLAETTIDPNANVGNKLTYPKLFYESYKPQEKMWSYSILYEKIKELFGEEIAKKCLLYLLDGSLYLHDSTKLTYYCASIDPINLILNGRQWTRTKSRPPKRVSSFLGQLVETLMNISQDQAGALAVGSFFICLAFLLIKEKPNILGIFKAYKKPADSFTNWLKNELQSFCYSINNECRTAGEPLFVNISLFDKPRLEMFLNDYNWLFNFKDESEKISTIKLIQYLQEIFLDVYINEPDLTFPVLTANFTVDDEGNILDEQFLETISKYNAESYRCNIYISHVRDFKINLCCRLSLDILKERQEDAGLKYGVDSYGNGAMSVASHRVVTINPVRLALLTKEPKKFIHLLEDRLEATRYILLAHRKLLEQWIKQDMFIVFSYGYLKPQNMFSTIGLLGLYETMEIFGYTEDKQKYIMAVDSLLNHVENYITDFIKRDKVFYNVECVPAESCANTLAKTDNLLFDYKPNSMMLYSNQFLPLWKNANFIDKIDIESNLIDKLSGGAIAFLQTGSKLTKEQMINLVKYCAKKGLRHFAVNGVITLCKNCNKSFFGKFDKCPECGNNKVELWSRIIGYFVNLQNFNQARQQEFWQRKNVL